MLKACLFLSLSGSQQRQLEGFLIIIVGGITFWWHCSWKPGFYSRCPHKLSGLVAESWNPASGGQEYLDGAGHLGHLTWLGLDLLVSLLGLET